MQDYVTPNKFSYDPATYDFARIIGEVFGTNELDALHENHQCFVKATDQSTGFHNQFYALPDDHKFFQLYRDFIKAYVLDQFEEPIVFQRKPTFRVHLQGNVAVGEWHKDSDYQHPREAINFFIPFTKAFDTNTIWCETREDEADYHPLAALYGEYYRFSGATLRHGNLINSTGKTRVSIDFRVLPKRFCEQAEARASTHRKMAFKVGEYYDEF